MMLHAPAEVQGQMLEELTSHEQVPILMSSVYGHYVARRLLQVLGPERRLAVEKMLSMSVAGLRNPRLREKWESVLAGEQPDELAVALADEGPAGGWPPADGEGWGGPGPGA